MQNLTITKLSLIVILKHYCTVYTAYHKGDVDVIVEQLEYLS